MNNYVFYGRENIVIDVSYEVKARSFEEAKRMLDDGLYDFNVCYEDLPDEEVLCFIDYPFDERWVEILNEEGDLIETIDNGWENSRNLLSGQIKIDFT